MGHPMQKDFQIEDDFEPIEVNVITGFLGAGKTTLINKLLAEGYGNAGTALLENEFGDVAIDSDLIAGENISVRTMSTGCICCTLRGDFVKNMVDIVQTYAPTRIFVEPTGLANLADILQLVDEAAKQVPLRLNAVITVVNAETLMPTLFVGGEFFSQQIEQACFVIVSCAQLVDEEDLQEVLDAVHDIHDGEVSLLFDDWSHLSAVQIMAAAEQAWDQVKHKNGADAHDDEPEHDHGHEHEHNHEHHHHHDADGRHVDEATGCISVAFAPQRIYTQDDLESVAAALASGELGTVFRAKGFLHGANGTVLFEHVYGVTHVSPSTYAGDPKFVVIGRNLNVASLEELFGGELL